MREPGVFLFDEPLSNLDAKLRVDMLIKICRLHRRSKVTSILSHTIRWWQYPWPIADCHEWRSHRTDRRAGACVRPASIFVSAPAMNLFNASYLIVGRAKLKTWAGHSSVTSRVGYHTEASWNAAAKLSSKPQRQCLRPLRWKITWTNFPNRRVESRYLRRKLGAILTFARVFKTFPSTQRPRPEFGRRRPA